MILKQSLISPGRIKEHNINDHNKNFTKTANYISLSNEMDKEVIAHGAGSWRYYPMGISCLRQVHGNQTNTKFRGTKDINTLVDATLRIDSSISIEIDVHYPPNDHKLKKEYGDDGGYIIHDKPKWKKKQTERPSVVKYLHNNSLKLFLEHFTTSDYHDYSKVYIEIKVDKKGDCFEFDGTDTCCARESSLLSAELLPWLSKYQKQSRENWICVTSFSPSALTQFRNQLPDSLKSMVDYVLIAGYTGGALKRFLAQSKGHVPEFDQTIKDFIINCPWLGAVWFSAQGIKDYNSEFNYVINQRKLLNSDFEELKFSFSTYQKKECSMNKLLKKKIVIDAQIESFMLDIDDK